MNKLPVRYLFLMSIFFTLSILALGVMIGTELDNYKIKNLDYAYKYDLLDLSSFDLSLNFLESWENEFNGNYCNYSKESIATIFNSIRDTGSKLSLYGKSYSAYKELEFDYLKREYFVMELKAFYLLSDIRNECPDINNILFFYKIDDNDSELMGNVLSQLSQEINNTYILSFDISYEDLSTLELIKLRYNLTADDAPVFILNGKYKYKGLSNVEELKNYIFEKINLKKG